MFLTFVTEISLTLLLLCGLLVRNGVSYINVRLLMCYQHALYNLYNFDKIERYAVRQLVETLLYNPQCPTFDY